MKIACFGMLLAGLAVPASVAMGQTLAPAWIHTSVEGVAPARYSADGSIFITNTGAFRASDNRQIASYYSTLAEPKPDGSGAILYVQAEAFGLYNLYDLDFATGSTQLAEQLPIDSMAISPDGTKLVVSSFAPEHRLITYRLNDFSVIKSFASPYVSGAPVLKFRPGSLTFVSSGPIVWNLNGTKIKQNPANTLPFALSPDGETIYQWMNANGKLQAFDALSNVVKWTKTLTEAVSASKIAVNTDGTRILFNNGGSMLKSLNSASGAPVAQLSLGGNRTFIDSSPTSGKVLVFGHDAAGDLGLDQQFYDPQSDQIGPMTRVNQEVFAFRQVQRVKLPSGPGFAYYDHHKVNVLSAATGLLMKAYDADSAAFAVSRDGSQIARLLKSSGSEVSIEILNALSEAPLGQLSLPAEPLSISASNKNRFLLQYSAQLKVYSYANGVIKLFKTFTLPSGFEGQAQLSPDGLSIALRVKTPAEVRLISVATGNITQRISVKDGTSDAYLNHQYLADGRLAIHEVLSDPSGYSRQAFRIYLKGSDALEATVLNALQETFSNQGADISPDGKKAAFVYTPQGLSQLSDSSTVKVFNVATGSAVRTYNRPFGYGNTFDLAFSTDAKMLNVNLSDAIFAVKL